MKRRTLVVIVAALLVGLVAGTLNAAAPAFVLSKLELKGSLDMGDNGVIIQDLPNTYFDPGTGAVYGMAGLKAAVIAGATGSLTWDGKPGINSAAAHGDATGLTCVGYVANTDLGWATWRGKSVAATDGLISYLYYGDADFNGLLNLDDYNTWSYAYENHLPASWVNGDFDFNGIVNLDDYNTWSYGYEQRPAPLFELPGAAGAAGSASAVPEPATIALMGAGLCVLVLTWLRRRLASFRQVCIVAVVGCLLFSCVASLARAELIYDLRAADGSKTVTLAPGTSGTVSLNLYASIANSDSQGNTDGFWKGMASFFSSYGGLFGDIAAARAPLFAVGAGQDGIGADLDGDGDKDWGSATGNDAATQKYFAPSSGPDSASTVVGSGGGGRTDLLIGTVTFQYGLAGHAIDVGQTTQISVVPRNKTDGTVGSRNLHGFKQDGANQLVTGVLAQAGAPVIISVASAGNTSKIWVGAEPTADDQTTSLTANFTGKLAGVTMVVPVQKTGQDSQANINSTLANAAASSPLGAIPPGDTVIPVPDGALTVPISITAGLGASGAITIDNLATTSGGPSQGSKNGNATINVIGNAGVTQMAPGFAYDPANRLVADAYLAEAELKSKAGENEATVKPAAAGANLSMNWRMSQGDLEPGVGPGFKFDALHSDVVDIEGIAGNALVSLKYNPAGFGGDAGEEALAAAGYLVVATRQLTGGDWMPAGTTFKPGPWAPADPVGTFGINAAANTAWVVVNHSSEFAVVPEPGTVGLLIAGGLGLVVLALRRRKA